MYDSWDLRLTELPPRSRLYHLPPIGIGTAAVESLTSYLMRLAEAHAVFTGTLIRQEILPLVITPPSRFHPATLHSLNGGGNYFRQWVAIIERLTLQADLSSLTLLSWNKIFKSRGTLRPYKAWCQQCLGDNQRHGQPDHELLLWTLSSAEVCPKHNILLADRCSRCRKRMSFLLARSRSGYCAHCGSWLGDSQFQPLAANCKLGTEAQARSATLLSEFLEVGNILNRQLSIAHVRKNLQSAVANFAGGRLSAFGRAAGLDAKTSLDWLNGNSQPSLACMIQLCQSLRLPLVRLFLEPIGIEDPAWTQAREIIHASQAAFIEHTKMRRSVVYHGTPLCLPGLPAIEVTAARQKLKAALKANLKQKRPRSILSVTLNLGYRGSSSCAWRWFPHLCAAITKKRKERHEQYAEALRAGLDEHPPPRIEDIAFRLKVTPGMLRVSCPALCIALCARRSERHLLETKQFEAELTKAITEDPPPSLIKLGVRLGRSYGFLQLTFPQLYRRLRDRYVGYCKTEIQRRNLVYEKAVCRAIAEITVAGKRPTLMAILSVVTKRSPALTSMKFVRLARKSLSDQRSLATPA